MNYGTISKQNLEISESPLLLLPGVDTTLSVSVKGAGTLSDATMVLYENGNDVSSTKLSGDIVISGRVIITKTFIGLVGGNFYKYYIYFTDNNVETAREGTLVVPNFGIHPVRYHPSATNRVYINESPITIYPFESKVLVLNVEGQGEITSPSMMVYKGTSNVSSSVLSGSITATGRDITLQEIGNLSGGNEYLIYIYFTDDGKSTCRYLEVICPKLGV